FARPRDRRAWIAQALELLRKLEYLNELVEFSDRDTKNVRRACAAHHIDEPVGHHFLLPGVPFLALAVDVNPDAEAVFFGERAIRNLDENLPVFLLALVDEHAGIRPAAITVDDPEFSRQLGMGLH